MHLEGTFEDLVNDCLREFEHFLFALKPQEVGDLLCADVKALVEEDIPDVFRDDALAVRHITLAAEELGIGILDKSDDVVSVQSGHDVLVDALLLQAVQLKEVGKPEHVLHQVHVLALMGGIT